MSSKPKYSNDLAEATLLSADLHPNRLEKLENLAENQNMFFERITFEMKDVVNVGVWSVLSHVGEKINHLSMENS